MTPAARISAAIDLMDRIQAGELADRALADWGRKNRYAGSKDRAAIADIVYDVLRRKRSFALLGGGDTGRALLLGYLRAHGRDPGTVFGADRYAPPKLNDAEQALALAEPTIPDASVDFPEWLWPELLRSLGDQVLQIAQAMNSRAPVHLRVNLAKVSREQAITRLALEGISAEPHSLSPSAVEVLDGARRIRNSKLYQGGEVELQDASSQAVADLVPLRPGEQLLDFCAGGGGKVLAVAGRVDAEFFAHDADPRRMKDLPARAARAGVSVRQITVAQLGQGMEFDTVLVDAPCSGSGSWRRDPQGKWSITPGRLDQLLVAQSEILDQTATLVRPQGRLVFATCSFLDRENEDQTRAFLSRHADFSLELERRFSPLQGGDGFYCAVFRRK